MTPSASAYCYALRVASRAASLFGAAILFALASCSSRPERAPETGATGTCAPSNADSERVPFVRASLGPSVHEGVGYVRGPRARALVRHHDEWAQLWKVIGDTVTLPKVDFGDSVLVVVASEDFGSGPARVEIEDVRNCGGKIVAFLRLHTQEQLNDYGDRSIRAVLIGRSHVGDRPVEFVDLPPDVLH
jgi:hypothetical protein